MKTVWILGAGFSRSLGGPLLGDLFSERLERELAAKFGMHAKVDTAERAALDLYRWGRGQTVRRRPGLTLWCDAEDYLDRLDSAVARGKHSDPWTILNNELARIGSKSTGQLDEIQLAARRWMAAECCAFLKDADPNTEKWEPYHRWAQSLSHSRDTIVTFNYDRVPDILFGNSMQVVLPGTQGEHLPGKILKLHGSVDWKRIANQEPADWKQAPKQTFQKAHDTFAINAAEEEIAIATPGTHKKRGVKQLDRLWNIALDALRNAIRVVFVGYRVPETDAQSRQRLLRAIHENQSSPLGLETVLGPDVGSTDSRRLEGLLRATKKNHPYPLHITQHPLNAEDFFTVHEFISQS